MLGKSFKASASMLPYYHLCWSHKIWWLLGYMNYEFIAININSRYHSRNSRNEYNDDLYNGTTRLQPLFCDVWLWDYALWLRRAMTFMAYLKHNTTTQLIWSLSIGFPLLFEWAQVSKVGPHHHHSTANSFD